MQVEPGASRSDLLGTYRELRLAMVLVLVLLFVAVLQRALTAPGGVCFETSISGYWYTSARTVLVGALLALATCLIVYRGNTDLEDVALDISGAVTFVVALVPARAPGATSTCSAANVPTPAQLDAAVTNAMVAFFITAAVTLAVAVAWRIAARAMSTVMWTGFAMLVVAYVVALVSFLVAPDGFRTHAHNVAAFGAFIGMTATVLFNAWGADRARGAGCPPAYRIAYTVIAATMIATFVVVGGAALVIESWRHGALVLEALLLVEFMAFWITQTVELWDDPVRDLPADAPTLLTCGERT